LKNACLECTGKPVPYRRCLPFIVQVESRQKFAGYRQRKWRRRRIERVELAMELVAGTRKPPWVHFYSAPR
jgi:hypothetical protein